MLAGLRRTPRAVYRVYSEDEYITDAVGPTEWYTPQAQTITREGRLRRLAGAAALTGAVGTVGGVIAIAIIGSRSPGSRIAASVGTAAQAALPTIRPASHARARPQARPRRTGQAHPARAVAGPSGAGDRSALNRQPVSPSSRRSRVTLAVAHAIRTWRGPTVASDSKPSIPAVAPPSAPSAPAEAAAKSPTQGEFGFER